MIVNIFELIRHSLRRPPSPLDVVLSDLAKAKNENERLRAIESRLVVENARLRKSDQDWTIANKLVAENVERLRAENAELKELVNSVDIGREVLSQRAELDWFERREQELQKLRDALTRDASAERETWDAAEAFDDWEKANPKPGSST